MKSLIYVEGSTRTGSSFDNGYDGTLYKFNKGIRSLSILLKELEIVSKV